MGGGDIGQSSRVIPPMLIASQALATAKVTSGFKDGPRAAVEHLPGKHPLFTKMFAACLAGETLPLNISPLYTSIIGPASGFSPALLGGCARTQNSFAAAVKLCCIRKLGESREVLEERAQIMLTLI